MVTIIIFENPEPLHQITDRRMLIGDEAVTTPNHNSPPAQTTNEHLEKLTAAVYRLERHLFDISLSMHALTINVRDMQLDRPSPSPPLEEL
ncbi:hypothetical protein QR680_018440 [Steinernema hermaphroditum]|uniref:Uncharacterized protein n=1 Tax=Steinernema hermaphroditum TaxID=289476 RepID=A0AA39HK25_9BILA|nr:hypothetical protein QR680_018440 [Steinernema hermaphroditum]